MSQLCHKLTAEAGGWIWQTPFAIICLYEQRFPSKPVAWGQVNRQRLEETMYVALSCLLYMWDLGEQEVGGWKLSYWGKGKIHRKGNFHGTSLKKTTQEVDHWTTLSRITYLFSLSWCKKVYALHNIPSY